MNDKFDDNLKGALFNENKSKVIKRGSFTIGGAKRYGVMVESENDKGQVKHELMFSAGLVYVHDANEKLNERSPDVGGKIYFDGSFYKYGAWNQVSANSGIEFQSCSLKPVDDEQKAPF